MRSEEVFVSFIGEEFFFFKTYKMGSEEVSSFL